MQPDMTSVTAVDIQTLIFDKHVPQFFVGELF